MPRLSKEVSTVSAAPGHSSTKHQIFGVPSLETAGRIDDSDRCQRAAAEHCRLSARMGELERQFEAKASELRAAFVTRMAEIFSEGDE